MAVRTPPQISYAPVTPNAAIQTGWIGPQAVTKQRGWLAAPSPVPNASPVQNSMAILGDRLFVVGGFTTPQAGIVAYNLLTGLQATWTATFGTSPVCVETDGTWLYVGGGFTSVNGISTIAGAAVNGLCRFDYNGTLDLTWNPAPNASPAITLLRYNPVNKTLYVSGASGMTFAGTGRAYIGEVNVTDSGSLTTWSATADGVVTAITVDAVGARVYLGGSFTHLFGVAKTRLGRATMSGGGALDSWAPAPDAQVNTILRIGQLTYVGGSFANIGSTPTARGQLAAITDTGTVSPWNPNAGGAIVYSMQQYRNVLLVGGTFTTIGGTGRTRLAAIRLDATGSLLAWNPGADAQVSALVLMDRTIYAAGTFTTVNGVGSANVASVPYPIFTNSNTKYVALTGSDAAAGTLAAPYRTITFAQAQLTAAFTYVVILDSGLYSEQFTVTYSANEEGGIYAADGQNPTITKGRGATPGTLGARLTGRTQFSGAAAAATYHVSKLGNDGTGARGNASLPFLTISAALADGARIAGDCIQIEDSGVYVENLTFAATSGTIQAAAGQVPTLVNVAAGNTLVTANAGVDFNLYGLTLQPKVSTSGNVVACSGNLQVYDCSFLDGGTHVQITGTTKTETIVNCQFTNSGTATISSVGGGTNTLTVTNCQFAGCNSSSLYTTGIVYLSTGGGTITVGSCTFDGCNDLANILFKPSVSSTIVVQDTIIRDLRAKPSTTQGIQYGVGNGGTVTVDNCLIFGVGNEGIYDACTDITSVRTYRNSVVSLCGSRGNCHAVTIAGKAQGGVTVQSVAALSAYASAFRCAPTDNQLVVFDRCVAMNAIQDGFSVSSTGPVTIKGCAEYGSNRAGTSPAAYKGVNVYASTNTTTVTYSAFASIDPAVTFQVLQVTVQVAFPFTSTFGGPYTVTPPVPSGGTWNTDVSVSAVFPGPGGNTTYQLTAVSGAPASQQYSVTAGVYTFNANNATSGFTNNNGGYFLFTFTYTLTGSKLVPSAGFIPADPKFLNVVSGSENCGVSGLSPCVCENLGRTNIGLENPMVTLAAANHDFTFDGLTFTGDLNFQDGLKIASGIVANPWVSWCAFNGLGTYGIQAASKLTVEWSLFATNGIAVNASESDITVNRCVGNQCAGTFLVVFAPAATVNHCTAFGCEYGQVDLPGASALAEHNCIYAENGVLDYLGSGTWAGSDIGNISGLNQGEPIATVNGSRLHPLFLSAVSPIDLRIQSQAGGQFADSPAKGLADDGTDAGAYRLFYAPIVTTWTVFDMAGTDAGSGQKYSAPFHHIRQVDPSKLAEGDLHGGGFYSTATAYPLVHVFSWDRRASMPPGQATILQAIYSDPDGEVLLSLDGGLTQIPCRVVHSERFSYKELDGLFFTNDTIPTPLQGGLALREAL